MPNVEIKAMLTENKNETVDTDARNQETCTMEGTCKERTIRFSIKMKIKGTLGFFYASETIGEIVDHCALHLSPRIFNMLYIIYNLLQDYSRPKNVISLPTISTVRYAKLPMKLSVFWVLFGF